MQWSKELVERMIALFAGGPLFSPDENTPFAVVLVSNDVQESPDLVVGDLTLVTDIVEAAFYGGGDHQNRWYYDPESGDIVAEQKFDAAGGSTDLIFTTDGGAGYPVNIYGYALITQDQLTLKAYTRFATPITLTKDKQAIRVPYPRIAVQLASLR